MTQEARCEKKSGVETGRIVRLVKNQLVAMGHGEKIITTKHIPVTVLRMENIPGIEAVVLIGYHPEKVNLLGVTHEEGDTVVTYKTDETTKKGSCMRVVVKKDQCPGFFLSNMRGNIQNISLHKVNSGRDITEIYNMQAFLAPDVGCNFKPGHLIANRCIITVLSSKFQKDHGFKHFAPFAIVQDIQPIK